MNEHIKELMYQAGLTAQGCWDELDEYDREAIEKLAELIVKECIDGHSANWEDIYDIRTRLLQDLGEELKEHFGVKE